MPRVHHVKKARKDYESSGIKRGDEYYWWKFRFGGTFKSKTPPRRSQLTQSSFLSTVYDLQDDIAGGKFNCDTVDDLKDAVEETKSSIEEMRDESEESLGNMPEHLQESSSSGEMLQERIDGTQEWCDNLDGIDIEVDEDDLKEESKTELNEDKEEGETATDEEIEELFQEKLQEKLEELAGELSECDPGNF